MAVTATLVAAALLAQGSEPAAEPKYPIFDDSPRCAPKVEPSWYEPCGFLRYLDLDPLTSRSGARVYRVAWDMSVARRDMWFKGGAVTLIVYPNGRRFLRTPWRAHAIPLRKGELHDFEARLARSELAGLGRSNTTVYADGEEGLCLDGVVTTIEALVDGRYRLAYFDNCGVAAREVALAFDDLLVLAAAKSGHTWPFHLKHPIYRAN